MTSILGAVNSRLGQMGYDPDVANFDGSTEYIRWNPDTPGLADTNTVSFIALINPNAGTGFRSLFEAASRFYVRLQSSDELYIYGADTGGSAVVSCQTVNTITESSTSVLMVSVDTTNALISAYLDNTDLDTSNVTFSSTNVIDITRGTSDIAANSSATPGEFFGGCLGPVWISDNEYIDFSSQANRDRVMRAPGFLTYPGSDGSNWSPTATAPEVFMADTLNNPTVNSGTGNDANTASGSPFTRCIKA